jgi:hypothetical protein
MTGASPNCEVRADEASAARHQYPHDLADYGRPPSLVP